MGLNGNILGQTGGFIFLVLCSSTFLLCWGSCLSTWFGGLMLEWLLNNWGTKHMLMRLWIQKRCVHLYLVSSTAIALRPRAKRTPATMDWRRRAAPVLVFAFKNKQTKNTTIQTNKTNKNHPPKKQQTKEQREESHQGFSSISMSAKLF